MNFEEQFPELKYLTLTDEVGGVDYKYGRELTESLKLNTGILQISKGMIEDNCLSKTRVKKLLIQTMANTLVQRIKGEEVHEVEVILERIVKELGLEEETK